MDMCPPLRELLSCSNPAVRAKACSASCLKVSKSCRVFIILQLICSFSRRRIYSILICVESTHAQILVATTNSAEENKKLHDPEKLKHTSVLVETDPIELLR